MNELNRRIKKKSIWSLLFVLILTGFVGAIVGCSNIQESSGNQQKNSNRGLESTSGQLSGYAENYINITELTPMITLM